MQEAPSNPTGVVEEIGFGQEISEFPADSPVGNQLMGHDFLVQVVPHESPVDFIIAAADMNFAGRHRGGGGLT